MDKKFAGGEKVVGKVKRENTWSSRKINSWRCFGVVQGLVVLH
jgi:hypothetical protein